MSSSRKIKARIAALTSVALVAIGFATVTDQTNAIASTAPALINNASITNVYSSRVLDMTNSSVSDAAALQQYWDHGGANQRWNIIPTDSTGTYVEIQNVNSGKCIDDPAYSTTSLTKLIQWTCKASTNQQWQMKRQSSGAYLFLNRASNMAMDVTQWSTADGGLLQQYPATYGSNQLFTIAGPGASTIPTDASGQGIPTGNLAGWKQTYVQDFNSAASDSTFDSTYNSSWCGYADGTGNKYFKDISAHDGLMDISLDGTKGAAGSFGNTAVHCATQYGRYSIRFKVEGAVGYGTAMMIWPNSNVWGDGEIDYPEGDFNNTISINQHGTNCTNCSAADHMNTGATFSTWHTGTTEWTPTGVKYYLDGNLIKTTTTNVPVNNHRMTIQMAPTAKNAQPGHFLVAWVAQWAPTK